MVKSLTEKTCDFCEELLGPVSVETISGERLHADCYDKWRREVIATQGLEAVRGAWGMKRGEA